MAKFITILTLFLITLIPLISTTKVSTCKKRRYSPVRKPQVVFVHGFSTGGFSWFRVRYELEMMGYKVTSIDLKASGIDPTDISKVNTFEEYNEPLDRFMAQLPEHEKVVLVGGSAGGVSVTKILHDHSNKVLVAVYMSATMLKSGYLTCADLEIGVPGFTEDKCHASCPKLPKPTCFNKTLLGWKEIRLKDRTVDYVLGKSLNRPGPFRAIVTTNFTEAAQKSLGIDRVPRVYVKTLLDKVLTPAQQDAMIKLWPPCEVVEIEYGHGGGSPQLLAALVVNATMYKSRT